MFLGLLLSIPKLAVCGAELQVFVWEGGANGATLAIVLLPPLRCKSFSFTDLVGIDFFFNNVQALRSPLIALRFGK